MPPRLFHVSEQADIKRFEPRPPPSATARQVGEMVWAIEERLLHNYLLPRDCPRVTCYAKADSNPEDIARLLGVSAARYIVAIEARWLPVVRSTRLYCYEFAPASFTLADAGAGYYISRQAVEPVAVSVIDDLLAALLERDIELRVTPSLWPLRDAILASSLGFSCIRMRNAQPPAG